MSDPYVDNNLVIWKQTTEGSNDSSYRYTKINSYDALLWYVVAFYFDGLYLWNGTDFKACPFV